MAVGYAAPQGEAVRAKPLRPWIHVTEVAEALGVTRESAYRWLSRRSIAVDCGRVWLAEFKEKAPEAWESLILARIDNGQ